MNMRGIGRYRWTICALLFFATTINYIDRQVLGLLAPTLQREIGWTESQYGAIISWFTAAYALGFLGVGRLMDRFGTRKGMAWSIATWSVAGMSHALASTVNGFSAARFALGLGESGNFPGAIATVAEWFPARERALATGIFNAGSNVGAILVPIFVPGIVLRWGWRAAFLVTGALGLIWLIAWLVLYQKPGVHPSVSARELAHIQSDPVESSAPIPWRELLRHRQTWAFAAAKFLTDPIWWFYLYWLPKFLDTRYGIHLDTIAAPLVVIYVIADFGSVGGGWLSSWLLARGATVNRARKTALLIAAVCIVPTMFAPSAPTMWVAVALVSVAAASHQWWSCNVFTLASDLFPRRAIGSVVGIGGFFGAVGGVLFQRATGALLQSNGGNYQPVFVVCGVVYLVALLVVHVMLPKLTPAALETA